MADLPLPADTARAYRSGQRQCHNFGLLFDRFVPYGVGWVMEGSQKSEAAQELVNTINSWQTDSAYKDLFDSLRKRQEAAISRQYGKSFTAMPAWRMVVGLGRDSAFETGMTLHRTYGCPTIPGSALKGITLAWLKATQEENGIADEEIVRLFGSDNSDKPQSGQIFFFDALPVTPPNLELDMLNPHYPEYYRPGQTAYPTDWQNPIPVYFLTVAVPTQFLFGIGSRRQDDDTIDKVTVWLREALRNLGVGGKTTSGYGYWDT